MNVEAERRAWLKSRLEADRVESLRYEYLLDEMTKLAAKDAEADLEPALEAAYSVVQGFHQSAKIDGVGGWEHTPNIFRYILLDQAPHIDSSGLEATVGAYLRLSFRFGALDRMLIDALIAGCLIEYYKQHCSSKLKTSLKDIGIHLLALIVLSGLWFYSSGGALGLIVVLVGVLYCACIILLGLVSLPFEMSSFARERKKANDVFQEIHKLYLSVASSGPISSSYVLRRVEALGDKGVIWPPPLMALLDDIQARGGRF